MDRILKLDDGRSISFDAEHMDSVIAQKSSVHDIAVYCEGNEKVLITRKQAETLGLVPALRATEECLKAHKKNGFFGLFIIGKPGVGKSSYVIRMLSEVYGKTGYDSHVFRVVIDNNTFIELPMLIAWERDWDAWKEWLIFLPDQFVKKMNEVQNTGKQEKCLGWDDAGVWLSKYNWASEFSQGVSDQFEVIRRAFATVVFTCPNNKKVLKTIREFPAMAKGKPVELRGGQDTERRIRVYEKDTDLGTDKEYSNRLFEEHFDVMLPDRVFKEYDPVSRMYGKIVTVFLERSLRDLKDRGAYKYAEVAKELMDMVKA